MKGRAVRAKAVCLPVQLILIWLQSISSLQGWLFLPGFLTWVVHIHNRYDPLCTVFPPSICCTCTVGISLSCVIHTFNVLLSENMIFLKINFLLHPNLITYKHTVTLVFLIDTDIIEHAHSEQSQIQTAVFHLHSGWGRWRVLLCLLLCCILAAAFCREGWLWLWSGSSYWSLLAQVGLLHLLPWDASCWNHT